MESDPSWITYQTVLPDEMDAEKTPSNDRKFQDGRSQTTTTYVSNPLMSDFVSDWSPMHDASIHGRLIALKKLITQGCSVNILTADQVSPLHEACLGGNPACSSLLLDQGAHVNRASIDWHTPLYNACISGSAACVKLLLNHGATVHATCDLASPIHEAAKRGYTECVDALASHGAQLEHSIQHLGTPLYVACENKQFNCAKKLLELGASANVGKDQDSPLHVAAKNSSADLVNLLINFGASVQSKNAEGKRPAELALPNSTVAQLFLEREGTK